MKFEFGDLYRFIVSLGVVLITLSVLVPWLFLKEPFDLFRTTTELAEVSVVAREAIETRQKAVVLVLGLVPWFSGIGCIIGAGCIFFGLKRWYRNQLLLDERTKVEVELKKQSLRDATKDEKAIAVERDFRAAGGVDAASGGRSLTAFESASIEVEIEVSNRLLAAYGDRFTVETDKMVGGVEIDVLLRGKSMLAKDYLVEIKSVRRGFNHGWLREAFLNNLYAKTIYAQVTGRTPNTILLIVLDPPAANQVDRYESLVERIKNESLGRKGKDVVVMISRAELQSLGPEEMRKRIGVFAQ